MYMLEHVNTIKLFSPFTDMLINRAERAAETVHFSLLLAKR